MEYPTFNSLLAALEENDVLLRVVGYAVSERCYDMQESVRRMKESARRLEKIAPCQAEDADNDDRKAA